ncbi:hypothetical protein B0H14DRAFT_3536222 [Mycena olivaceomarginata]|nr:hypothetical protein B0H14DRAFT_3536222 [Mycena olivaceomarginata]
MGHYALLRCAQTSSLRSIQCGGRLSALAGALPSPLAARALLAPALPFAPDSPDVGSLRIRLDVCAPGLRSALAQVRASFPASHPRALAPVAPPPLQHGATATEQRPACGGLLLDYHSVCEWVGGQMTKNDAGVGRGMEEDGIRELKKSTGTVLMVGYSTIPAL